MRLIVAFLILTLSSAVGAHPLDSISSPLRTPFRFTFRLNPLCSTSVYFGDSLEDEFKSGKFVSASGDTLNFSYPSYLGGLQISFDTLQRSILSLAYNGFEGHNEGYWETISYLINLRDLRYDTLSIYALDSNLENHLASSNYRISWGTAREYHNCTQTEFSSILLGGIFRNMHLTKVSGEVKTLPTSDFKIRSSLGSVVCSFAASDHARIIEVYSPIGVRIGSFNILPAQTSISLPSLRAGLYFLRLEGAVMKAYFPPE